MTENNQAPAAPAKAPATQKELLHELGKNCVSRMNTRGLKGKKRDDAVVEYIAGAAQMVDTISEGKYDLKWAFFSVCTSGACFKEVERWAHPDFLKDKDEKKDEPAPDGKMTMSDASLINGHGHG